ncbi:MAG: hypothetical protein ABFD24_05545 [Anaerolineaceae bacterium]|jgi:hypothetical protein
MKIYSNEKLIKRNSRLGQIASIVSLVVLGVGMYFSFKDTQGKYVALTFGSLIVGFLVFQFGNYYLSRWGKSPRPDELISASLKGLDDRFSIYHYTTPLFHLLVGPNCVFVLLPYNQAGSLYFDTQRNRWRQHGGNAFLKLFGNEGLGRPDAEARYAQSDLENYVRKLGLDSSMLKNNVILVFTNPKAEISLENSPSPAITGEKLKEYLRKKLKENPLPAEWVSEFQQKLPS